MGRFGYALVLVVLLVATIGGGWYSATLNDDGLVQVAAREGSEAVAQLQRPSKNLGLGVRTLERLGLAVPDEPVAPAVPLPPPPPEPNVAEELRRDMTAVLKEGSGRVLLVVDRPNGNSRVKLKQGDPFRYGWKVSKITQQEIILSRGEEKRSLPVMSLDIPTPEQPGTAVGQPPVPPGQH